MVREDVAAALVADVALVLAARGHDPVVTVANSVRLVRLAVLLCDAFGVGTETTEESDD